MRLIERFLDWYLINGVRLGVLIWLAILGPLALAKLFWSTS